MRDTALLRRLDLWLPAAGLVVASALVVLGAAATRALEDRHTVALDGRLLRLAQQVERELRESGPELADEVLGERLTGAAGLAAGLAGLDATGQQLHQAGHVSVRDTRDVDLHLGRFWHQGAGQPGAGFGGTGPGAGRLGLGRQGGMPGRRVLRIAVDPAALGQAASERLLLPVTVFSGIVLAALSLLGGRLLTRQQHEQQTAAERRRLEVLARAGAGLAHQLRTPLATIKGSCQLLLEDAGETGGRRLQTAVSQAERMEKMLQRLLDYARPPGAEPAAVDLAAAARELAELDPRRLRPRVEPGLAAQVDPEHLHEILTNLADNALRASGVPEEGPGNGTVEVTAAAAGRSVEIRVADRGGGPGDDPESLFEPYVTRRADGTGLGLPIARALAEANDGRLHLEARPGGGTAAVLRLPRAEVAT